MNPHQRDNNKAGTEEQDDDLTHFKRSDSNDK